MAQFHLMQPAASAMAERVDAIFTAMLILCGGVALVLCLLVIVFAVRFRAGSKVPRGQPVRHLTWLEVVWSVVPLLLFIGIYVWASLDFMRLYQPPADALPVAVVARQWMWTLQHRNGRREINELHVPLGQPVLLTMTSQDAIHSFYVPAFRVKQDVLPGRYTGLWFNATQLGEFPLFCAEYCGSDHSQMTGRIVVMPAAEYGRWLKDVGFRKIRTVRFTAAGADGAIIGVKP